MRTTRMWLPGLHSEMEVFEPTGSREAVHGVRQKDLTPALILLLAAVQPVAKLSHLESQCSASTGSETKGPLRTIGTGLCNGRRWALSVLVVLNCLASLRIENETMSPLSVVVEVKHSIECAGNGVG